MGAPNKFFALIFAISLVCVCICMAHGAKNVRPVNVAKTAQEEWERVRHNTAITSAPTIVRRHATGGVFDDAGIPYKSLAFPVTGYDDPGCEELTKCNQWDWANHTLPNYGNLHSDASFAGRQPAWVKNMSFIPNFTCYDGDWLKWGGSTTSQFQDPIPAGHFVVKVCILHYMILLLETHLYDSPY